MAFSAPLWLDAHLVTMCDRSGGANDGLPEASSIRPGLAGLPESRSTKTEMPIDVFAPHTSMWVSCPLPAAALPQHRTAAAAMAKIRFLLFLIFNCSCFTHTQTHTLKVPATPSPTPGKETTITGTQAEHRHTKPPPTFATPKLTNKPKSH